MKRILLVAIGATLFTLGAFGIASAHATLDHCTPVVGSTVATAPAQIVCIYSEEIDSKRSTMSVWNASGSQVDKKDAHLDLNDPDHKTLIVSLDPTKSPNGLYTVKWHTVTPDDNGISDGSWQFVVGSANATPYPPVQVVQGETPAAANAASTATPAASSATATPAATAAPAANATPAAPKTAPATGAPENSAWMLLALLGAALVLGGTLLRVRR
jgi:methionine-rich copper-binding protein CopC